MLLRFRVANALSLRDEQELSFVVPHGEDPGLARSVALSDGKTIDVYPILGIFGANASGKSNVLTALNHMRRAVLSSYADWTSYEGVPRDRFALDPKAADETTFFEVDFVLEDGVRWTYGFELSDSRVEAEWLHAYPKGRRQEWMDRDAAREREFSFPGDRIQDRARLARTTRPNALLLSRAATDNHPQLSRIYHWFQRNLWDIGPETERRQREVYTAKRIRREPRVRARIEELLRVADLGITEVRLDDEPRSGQPDIRLVHTGSGGSAMAVDWEHESFGTRSWFALLGPLLLALDEGAVLLVDELDTSLHPRFAAEVVRLFQTPSVNKNDAQLVFTSHDPSLLSTPRGGRLLDPGQIWLTEKDERGATELYPLSDANPGEKEDLTDSYLAGAFGAIPRVTEGQIGRRLVMVKGMEAERS
ncbi:ATP-binding protein [Nocardiopsis rhodophaea]|uniref:AAA family ATPase n=1 Tax=Nocardiopsis rhodophaea TaxID=280238 RepID=UPI0031D5A298